MEADKALLTCGINNMDTCPTCQGPLTYGQASKCTITPCPAWTIGLECEVFMKKLRQRYNYQNYRNRKRGLRKSNAKFLHLLNHEAQKDHDEEREGLYR